MRDPLNYRAIAAFHGLLEFKRTHDLGPNDHDRVNEVLGYLISEIRRPYMQSPKWWEFWK